MSRFYSVVTGWCLLWAWFFPANALEQDFFPLAVGNWWEFTTKTGQIERWEITGNDSNTFILNQIYKEPDYSQNRYLSPSDDKGRINRPCGRDQGCIWAPQVMLPGTTKLVAPWGAVEKSRLYRVTWGHPSGGDWSCILAPGIGPVARCYSSEMSESWFDTVAILSDYHLETVPTTRSHSIAGATQADTGLLITWTGGPTAEVSARTAGPSDAQWYVVSGYNPLAHSIRIYLADTASHPSGISSAVESCEHLFTIEHLDPDSLYRFKMYRVAYDTVTDLSSVRYDSIQSVLLYDSPLMVEKVSAGVPAHFSVPGDGITVSGRTVTIRNGIPGNRMSLSCILFSVDGRCIARRRIGKQQNKVSMVAPGAGVYVLRIRNGNASWRMLRIIIAR